MPSSLNDLRTDLRSHLSEYDARQWSDAELNRWINEGARDLCRRTECLRDSTVIDTSEGVSEYTGPVDTVRLHDVSYDDGGIQTFQLEYRDFQSMEQVWGTQRGTEGRPYCWTTWGMPPNLRITIFPSPTDSLGSLNVLYYRLPADALDDESTIEVPEGWQDAVVTYAEMVALRKDGNQAWRESKELYMEKMSDLLATALRFNDQAGGIDRWDGGGSLPGWLVGD